MQKYFFNEFVFVNFITLLTEIVLVLFRKNSKFCYNKKTKIMNYVYRIENWAENHQVKWLASLRIVLGLIIFLKGLLFIMNTDALLAMITNSAFDLYAVLLVHLVALAHLLGGLLIMMGLITRIAVLFQIPILAGAIIFVNSKTGFFSIHSELALSVLVLVLLLLFLVFGSGKFSVDEWMKKNSNSDH